MQCTAIPAIVSVIEITVMDICLTIGIVFIIMLMKNGNVRIQHILWLNWSGFVMILNTSYILFVIIKPHVSNEMQLRYIIATFYTVFSCFTILAQMFINFDRLFLIILNIKYSLYVTKERVKSMIFLIWPLSVATFLALMFGLGFDTDPYRYISQIQLSN